MNKKVKILSAIISLIIGFLGALICISIYENWMGNSLDPLYGIALWMEFQEFYWTRFWVLGICLSLSAFSVVRDYYRRKKTGKINTSESK